MKLQTERLLLRELKKSDAKDIYVNLNNLNVSKWLLMVPYPYTLKDSIKFINNSIKESKKKDREIYDLGIELKDNKKIIGVIGIKVKHSQDKAVIGYWLGPDYHRKGYGREALQSIINFCFNKLNLRRIEAHVFVGNPSSYKILEREGFKLEGTLRQAAKNASEKKIYDDMIYGLLKQDWKILN